MRIHRKSRKEFSECKSLIRKIRKRERKKRLIKKKYLIFLFLYFNTFMGQLASETFSFSSISYQIVGHKDDYIRCRFVQAKCKPEEQKKP